MKALKVHPNDDIVVALTDLQAGDTAQWEGGSLTLTENVKAKHKFAEKDFKPGDHVHMYGVLVGTAQQHIAKGALISTQNLKHAATDYQYTGQKQQWQGPDVSTFAGRTFNGYYRADGSVGTANYWLVVPMVFCENRNLNIMREALLEELGYEKSSPYKYLVKNMVADMKAGHTDAQIVEKTYTLPNPADSSQRMFKNVDGVKFLMHQAGCGGTRQDANALCALLAGYITHPNVAGVTVLSLGCQHAEVSILQNEIKKRDANFSKPMHIFTQQEAESEQQLLTDAIKTTFAGLAQINQLQRQPAPLSKLTIGLECGGSDGFSGISANPAVGVVSDMLAALGGTPVLSEFPELAGVEQELVDRCVNEATARKFISIMRAYEKSAEEVGSGFDANPSPGNIKDGLITDAIKSAGAARKGGTSPVTDVLDYPEKATKPGLNLLCTPGNDVESTTGLAAAGCNIILFTTGLGTPTGNPVAPTLKIASNTTLANRMPDIIDINAGTIIEGTTTLRQKADQMLEFIIKVASGEITPKAVALGQDDFIPWRRGVSL